MIDRPSIHSYKVLQRKHDKLTPW